VDMPWTNIFARWVRPMFLLQVQAVIGLPLSLTLFCQCRRRWRRTCRSSLPYSACGARFGLLCLL